MLFEYDQADGDEDQRDADARHHRGHAHVPTSAVGEQESDLDDQCARAERRDRPVRVFDRAEERAAASVECKPDRAERDADRVCDHDRRERADCPRDRFLRDMIKDAPKDDHCDWQKMRSHSTVSCNLLSMKKSFCASSPNWKTCEPTNSKPHLR